jgi:hypothetical protein
LEHFLRLDEPREAKGFLSQNNPCRRPGEKATVHRFGGLKGALHPVIKASWPVCQRQLLSFIVLSGANCLTMEHRHLIKEDYSLTAIEDIISRGLWADWIDLANKALNYTSILDDIEHICRHFINDPYAQRFHFWLNYVKKWRPTR